MKYPNQWSWRAGTNTDPTMKQPLQNINDLWEAFGWSEGTKKKLPNEKSRISDESLKEAGGSGWSTMVQSVLTAATRTAEILYPANSHSLLLEVASRLTQGSTAFDAKDHEEVIRNTIMIMKKSKKRSVQGRVAQAILVNGLPASRIDALKMDGNITLGGSSIDQARRDFKQMEAGQSLCIPAISQCRFDEKTLEEAVMFILSKDNVVPIS